MTEIGVERLRAGNGEKDGAERDQADHAVPADEMQRVPRIERGEHRRVGGDQAKSRDRDRDEPDQRHRSEQGRDLGGAVRLHGEQRDQDDRRQRHDVGLECGCCDLQAFDRRQHRQRGRDHGVAVEQRAADRAEQHQQRRAAPERALRQRHEGERAALAIVVGTQQDQDVFQRDDDDQRPEDQ
jgi:hypothetical protein